MSAFHFFFYDRLKDFLRNVQFDSVVWTRCKKAVERNDNCFGNEDIFLSNNSSFAKIYCLSILVQVWHRSHKPPQAIISNGKNFAWGKEVILKNRNIHSFWVITRFFRLLGKPVIIRNPILQTILRRHFRFIFQPLVFGLWLRPVGVDCTGRALFFVISFFSCNYRIFL